MGWVIGAFVIVGEGGGGGEVERYLGFWDAEMLGAGMGWDGMGVPVRREGTGSLVAFMASMWVDYVGGLFVKGYVPYTWRCTMDGLYV